MEKLSLYYQGNLEFLKGAARSLVMSRFSFVAIVLITSTNHAKERTIAP